ncbi:MAG: hypothetical protein MUC50_08395 [Myxococcota bacterium]|jgi:ABC-type phosphate transport system substrate-binding protein|nr:hypothetical protein [Myxococcota bacterium]
MHTSHKPPIASLLAAAVLGLAMSGSTPVQAQKEDPYDLMIVCNKAVKDNIDVATVRDLFLRKRLTWPSGANVVPINASMGSKLRREFQRRVLLITDAEETKYWEKNKIMSALTAPPEFEGTLRAVFKLSGSLTYVFRAQFKEGVSRVMFVVPSDEKSYEGGKP